MRLGTLWLDIVGILSIPLQDTLAQLFFLPFLALIGVKAHYCSAFSSARDSPDRPRQTLPQQGRYTDVLKYPSPQHLGPIQDSPPHIHPAQSTRQPSSIEDHNTALHLSRGITRDSDQASHHCQATDCYDFLGFGSSDFIFLFRFSSRHEGRGNGAISVLSSSSSSRIRRQGESRCTFANRQVVMISWALEAAVSSSSSIT
ncbi:hypothetical protein FJTKL_05612 [Diaporthe vaccinii]|uniref:Uncharacterized protein n=1 Tax=Diaporthe vaccinii TaxID=105482 RepID=A0ABR4DRZ2_9PEZI